MDRVQTELPNQKMLWAEFGLACSVQGNKSDICTNGVSLGRGHLFVWPMADSVTLAAHKSNTSTHLNKHIAAIKKSLIMLKSKTYWPQDWHNDHPVVNEAEKSGSTDCVSWMIKSLAPAGLFLLTETKIMMIPSRQCLHYSHIHLKQTRRAHQLRGLYYHVYTSPKQLA